MSVDLVALLALAREHVPTLDDDKAVEVQTVTDRSTDAALVVETGVGKALPNAQPIAGVIPMLSAEAVKQAEDYLARDAREHLLDGLAHHVFNTLRAQQRGPDITEPGPVDKLALMNAVPQLLDVEVVWREKSKTDPTLATALAYWDRAATIDARDALPQKILGMLQQDNILDDATLALLVAACCVTRAGEMTSPLADAKLEGATFDDVRDALAVGGF